MLGRGREERDLAVETPGATQRRVEIERSGGGCDDEDARRGEEAVDAGEKLRDDLDVAVRGLRPLDAETVDVLDEDDGESGGVVCDDGGGLCEEVWRGGEKRDTLDDARFLAVGGGERGGRESLQREVEKRLAEGDGVVDLERSERARRRSASCPDRGRRRGECL